MVEIVYASINILKVVELRGGYMYEMYFDSWLQGANGIIRCYIKVYLVAMFLMDVKLTYSGLT